jgi:hypothetical protein
MLRRDVDLVREYLADGGPKELARRVAGRVLKVAKTARQKQHDNG